MSLDKPGDHDEMAMVDVLSEGFRTDFMFVDRLRRQVFNELNAYDFVSFSLSPQRLNVHFCRNSESALVHGGGWFISSLF